MTPPPDLETLVSCWLTFMAFALLIGSDVRTPPRPPRPA